MRSLSHIRRARGFGRARRGSILVEFTLGALFLIVTLMATVEFAVEVYVRQSAERAVSTAANVYARTRSPQRAQDAVAVEMPGIMDRCIEPLTIGLFDDTDDLSSAPRPATGFAPDNPADLALITVTCRWERLTPPARLVFGATMRHDATALVRMRGGG